MKAEGQVRALVAKGEWVPNKIKVSKRGLLKSKAAAIGGPEEVLLKAHVSASTCHVSNFALTSRVPKGGIGIGAATGWYGAMDDRALPNWPRRMKAALAAAYVASLRERYLYDNNNQRKPSDQDIAEFPADNSMLGMALLVYDSPKPGLGKPTSGAEVLKEKARLEPLVEAATQAAVEERGRTLDKD